jgi:predicted anti-sigma-YlaC factor YlaD
MFCESWREKLSEAALSGERLPGKAEAHLAACGACREAFAEERQLSESIDGGLRSMVKAEVPASLVPGVRAEIARMPETTAWQLPKLAFAAGAVFVFAGIALSLAQVFRTTVQPDQTPVTVVEAKPPMASKTVEEQPRVLVQSEQRAVIRRQSPTQRILLHSGPEVLLSQEEQIGFQRYVELLRTRALGNPAVAIAQAGALEIPPMRIAEMEWKELSIEPLEDSGSR